MAVGVFSNREAQANVLSPLFFVLFFHINVSFVLFLKRTDSFDVLLKNKVRKEFKGKEISYGKVVGQGLSQQTGKEDEVRK